MQLSLIPNDRLTILHCSQNDTTLRKWQIELYANDVLITPIGEVNMICENGAEISGVIENNSIVFDCTNELSKKAGIYKCKVKMVNGDEVIYSSLFNLYCEVKP